MLLPLLLLPPAHHWSAADTADDNLKSVELCRGFLCLLSTPRLCCEAVVCFEETQWKPSEEMDAEGYLDEDFFLRDPISSADDFFDTSLTLVVDMGVTRVAGVGLNVLKFIRFLRTKI